MNIDTTKGFGFAFVFGITTLLCVPQISYAQFVPVRDQQLITDFGAYVGTFTDVVSGANPAGAAQTPCHRGVNWQPALPYATGAWTDASNRPNSTIPTSITSAGQPANSGNVGINDSASLRCLLQELVEWEKLGLSVQIHAMLKTYIADAQHKQLNNQLSNRLSSAKLSWGQSGNSVTNAGVITTEPVYVTNASQSIYNVKSRQLDHIADQAAADPSVGNPAGSLAICDPWRTDATADIVRNGQLLAEDPFNSTVSRTQCGLSNTTYFADFSDSFNNTNGGMGMFMQLVSDPTASPLGTSQVLAEEMEDRLARQEQAKRDEFANTGERADVECSGISQDPHCLDQQYGTAVTPAFIAGGGIENAAFQGDEQIARGDTLDSGVASTTELQSVSALTGGFNNYDETSIANTQTGVDDLVREFYDIIDIGYFGIQQETIDWAHGTMLMIYDEMKFDPTGPTIVVTDGTTPDTIDI